MSDPRAQENLPFRSGRDAAVYLVEVSGVALLASVALVVLMLGDSKWAGVFPAAAAGLLTMLTLAPRAKRLPMPTEWSRTEWNEQEREMLVFRLRYVRAALRDRGIPQFIAYCAFGACLGAVLLAAWLSRRDVF